MIPHPNPYLHQNGFEDTPLHFSRFTPLHKLTHLPTTSVSILNNAREIAHCGVIIDAGSRDETAAQNGIAHFIEHVIFKGTAKRKAYHVLSRLEDVGGELNLIRSYKDNPDGYFMARYSYQKLTTHLY